MEKCIYCDQYQNPNIFEEERLEAQIKGLENPENFIVDHNADYDIPEMHQECWDNR